MRLSLRALLFGFLLAAAALPARAQMVAPSFKSPIPSMTDAEYSSFACMTGAAVAGSAAVFAGSVYVIATGGVAATSAPAIAVPVLVATIASGCSIGQNLAPALAWLHFEGERVVDEVEAKLDQKFARRP